MESAHGNLQTIRPELRLPADAADRSTAIQELFVELVDILERLKHCPPSTVDTGPLECWDDDQFLYLQTDLHSIFDSEIDINVHEGRVHIRLER